MDNITFKKILDFLEKEENKISKIKGTLRWKLTFNEPIEKDDLIVKNDLDFGYINSLYKFNILTKRIESWWWSKYN